MYCQTIWRWSIKLLNKLIAVLAPDSLIRRAGGLSLAIDFQTNGIALKRECCFVP
jgi:hypothetical protein